VTRLARALAALGAEPPPEEVPKEEGTEGDIGASGAEPAREPSQP